MIFLWIFLIFLKMEILHNLFQIRQCKIYLFMWPMWPRGHFGYPPSPPHVQPLSFREPLSPSASLTTGYMNVPLFKFGVFSRLWLRWKILLLEMIFKPHQIQISCFSRHFYDVNIILILIQIHSTNFDEKNDLMTESLRKWLFPCVHRQIKK